MLTPQNQLANLFQVQKAGSNPIVQVVCVVGDTIRAVGDLSLKRRKAVPLHLRNRIIRIKRVFADAFENLPGKVEPVEFRVLFFKQLDNAKPLLVVFESAIAFH